MCYKKSLRISVIPLLLSLNFVVKSQVVEEAEFTFFSNPCSDLILKNYPVEKIKEIEDIEVSEICIDNMSFSETTMLHITSEKVMKYSLNGSEKLSISGVKLLSLTPKEFFLKSQGPYANLNDGGGYLVRIKLNNGRLNIWGLVSDNYSDEVNEYRHFIIELLQGRLESK